MLSNPGINALSNFPSLSLKGFVASIPTLSVKFLSPCDGSRPEPMAPGIITKS